MVDHVIDTLEANIRACKFSDYSSTFIPHYDIMLSKDLKKYLHQVKMSKLCHAKV